MKAADSDRHQVSPKGRAPSSNDQAERRCLPSIISVSAMSSGFTKKSSGLFHGGFDPAHPFHGRDLD
jgi:hypothetical protein